ncbi:MAG TPA: hypothetical protein PLU37_01190 [Chitinophagaceae bacterium]|nr:hypothetical protein [Chitinophagaceae bacterium]
MKRILIIAFVNLITYSANAQDPLDCFTRLQKAFDNRGANPAPDGMHQHVYLSFFEDGTSRCISGKVQVENNKIVSVYLQYADDTFGLLEPKFYNSEKKQPTIKNGISEMIYTSEGEKFKIVFIELLKPKAD